MSEWRPGIAVTAQRHSGSIRGSPDEVMRGNASQYLHNFRSGALIDIPPRSKLYTARTVLTANNFTSQCRLPLQRPVPRSVAFPGQQSGGEVWGGLHLVPRCLCLFPGI